MSMPNATAQQIGLFALRKLGVVSRQMPVQVDDMKDAMEGLWFLLDSFSRQGLIIPFVQPVTTTLTEDKLTLTIGIGGDFDVTPPIELSSLVVDSGGSRYTVQAIDGIGSFNELSLYSDQRQYPRFYHYIQSSPAQSLTFDAYLLAGDVVTIYGKFPISTSFDIGDESTSGVRTVPNPVNLSLTEETEFGAGYQSMLMWNLAEYLLPEYPQDNGAVVQQIIKEAKSSRDNIKTRNNKGRSLQFTDTNMSRWGRGCGLYQWR